MSTTSITNNPTMQLASLIKPHEDRLLAMRARSYDAYVMVDGQMMINPRPPLMSPNMATRGLFDVLAAGVGKPGDTLKIVRLSEARIGVYSVDGAESEEDLIESYGEYITAIECPSKFARAWRELASLIYDTANTIANRLETLLEQTDSSELEARIDRSSELAAIEALSSYVTSLRKLLSITGVFYGNSLMEGRFEMAFVRGQKHQIGNELFVMTLLNYLLDSTGITYQDIFDLLEDTRRVFNPIAHIEKAFNGEDVGKWLGISIKSGTDADIRPEDGPSFISVIDDILYRAGSEANGTPKRIDVRWHAEEGVLSLWTDGDAFRAFDAGSPARKRLADIYGGKRFQFIRERSESSPPRISTIRIAVEPKGSADGGDGGGGTTACSDFSNNDVGGADSQGMETSAETYMMGTPVDYTTTAALATMAMAAVHV